MGLQDTPDISVEEDVTKLVDKAGVGLLGVMPYVAMVTSPSVGPNTSVAIESPSVIIAVDPTVTPPESADGVEASLDDVNTVVVGDVAGVDTVLGNADVARSSGGDLVGLLMGG